MTEIYLEQVPALIAELRAAEGDGTDWTEDLFRRAADTLTALSTAPADDVREALPSSDGALTPDQVMQHAYANAVTRAPGRMAWGEALRHFEMWMREHDARLIAEVRPRGTVTDAEHRDAVHRAVRVGIESVRTGHADRDVVRAVADQVLALDSDVRPRGTATDTEDADVLIAETLAFLAERPMGPPIYHRIGKLVAALEAAREARS